MRESPVFHTTECATCKEAVELVAASRGSSGTVGECSICLEPLLDDGDHRACCLACGHVFGVACLEQWLGEKHRCPQCSAKASKKHIRVLFAPGLTAPTLNPSQEELEKVACALHEERRLRRRAEEQIERLKAKSDRLLKQLEQARESVPSPQARPVFNPLSCSLQHKHTRPLTGARVAAHAVSEDLLVVTCENASEGAGLTKISLHDYTRAIRIPRIHASAIRDVQPELGPGGLVLTVSHDKTAKLTSLKTDNSVASFDLGLPLWSCAWDPSGPSPYFCCGRADGSVCLCDLRVASDSQPARPVWTAPGPTRNPVHSLCQIAPPEPPGATKESGLIAATPEGIWGLSFDAASGAPPGTGPVCVRGMCIGMSTAAYGQTSHAVLRAAHGDQGLVIEEERTLYQGGPSPQMARPCAVFMPSLVVATSDQAACQVRLWDAAGTAPCVVAGLDTKHEQPVLSTMAIVRAEATLLVSVSNASVTVHEVR
eukprot:m51a1_g3526 putative e3 ubiquitin-protein ligase rfwd3 (485) ;mRNA; r:932139-934236